MQQSMEVLAVQEMIDSPRSNHTPRTNTVINFYVVVVVVLFVWPLVYICI
jgi:hypothetical protein